MGIGHDVLHDLLLVRVGIDAADDGDIHLDEPGRKLQQAVLVGKAAAVIVQREHAGEARRMALGLQRFVVNLLFLGDLNDHLTAQLMPAAIHILAVLSGQADACNGVDEQHRVPAHKALAAQVVEGLQRFEEGQPLDLIQCALLPRQLHDGSG